MPTTCLLLSLLLFVPPSLSQPTFVSISMSCSSYVEVSLSPLYRLGNWCQNDLSKETQELLGRARPRTPVTTVSSCPHHATALSSLESRSTFSSTSQMLTCVPITRDLVNLQVRTQEGWVGLRLCISCSPPGDVDAAGPEMSLGIGGTVSFSR